MGLWGGRSLGRVYQAEKTAHAKALRQDYDLILSEEARMAGMIKGGEWEEVRTRR